MSWQDILKGYSEKVRQDIDKRKEEIKNMSNKRVGQESGKAIIYEQSHELADLTNFGEIKPEDLDENNYERFLDIVAFEKFFNEQPSLKRKRKEPLSRLKKPKQRPNIDPNQPSIFDL